MAAQAMGFEVRWRLDPILTPAGWLDMYRAWLSGAQGAGHRPSRITLGTYRESTPQLHYWRAYWQVPEMEWRPEAVSRDGTHWHISAAERVAIYRAVAELCARYMPQAVVSICKETRAVRRESGLTSGLCNCLGSCETSSADARVHGCPVA